MAKVLVINPGSTSTKIAVFEAELEAESKLFAAEVEHGAAELALCEDIPDQTPLRKGAILGALESAGISLDSIDVFVGRGGGLDPCEGGTYIVEGLLLEHARSCHSVKHPSVLGAVLSHEFASERGKPAYTVDPPDVDELSPVARISGLKEVPRESRFHALNQKEVCRRAAASLGKTYESSNFVAAHIGGGISIAAHQKGRVVDVNDIINGDGPMAPTRCGQISAKGMVDLCFGGKYGEKEIRGLISKNGGLVNHLGTSSILEALNRAAGGDSYALLVIDALGYQISKSIGACASVLKGQVDAIVLTGGASRSEKIVGDIREHCGYIADFFVYPGEFEMEALAHGALRVWRGQEEAKAYTGKQD
ncbi:MAG: butyrate kinase [Clostridiales bacterium]|jgi:butyrate kinase|nr:butyrate kinase [Clostridiales bacterium]